MRPAKLCLAPPPNATPHRPQAPPPVVPRSPASRRSGIASPTGTIHPRASREQSPKTSTPPSHCHRGIFISPQRNENIRDLRRTAGMTPHRNPAPPIVPHPKKIVLPVVPKRRLGMRPAKRRFAPLPIGEQSPKTNNTPSYCHRGIFISPQRNENIRDLRRTAGMTPHRNPAPPIVPHPKKIVIPVVPKRRFAPLPIGEQSPKTNNTPSHCHRGIFISPQRNENIRDLRRTAGMTPHRNPAPPIVPHPKKL